MDRGWGSEDIVEVGVGRSRVRKKEVDCIRDECARREDLHTSLQRQSKLATTMRGTNEGQLDQVDSQTRGRTMPESL